MGKVAPVRGKADGLTLRLRILLFALVDAVYYCMVSVTTVGYGDVHARTTPGKVMAVLLILTGTGTFGGMVATLTELLLNRRERRARAEKLNMVIGVFFSELGTTLLTYFSDFDSRLEEIKKDLLVTGSWSAEEFDRVSERIRRYEYSVDARAIDFEHLRNLLASKRAFLLRLLENPSLMEHELFTDLLLAVFHLAEELTHRKKLRDLPDSDQAHLNGDVKRIYGLLVHQWLDHMRYLKTSYPYLFSLAIRTNPFDEKASPIVTS